ncbi:hypothetical protein MTO96_021340 [Rhipicephalus appendiculatus]
MAGVVLLSTLLVAATSVGGTDVLRQNVSLNVDLLGVRLLRLPDDARPRRLVVVRSRRRKNENDDPGRMEDMVTDDDSTSWEGVADGENDQFMDGIHADFLNSLATLPRALSRGENVMDGSFNSSEYLDRHLMFLRKRRQGPPPNAGPPRPPWLAGRPAGPGGPRSSRTTASGTSAWPSATSSWWTPAASSWWTPATG